MDDVIALEGAAWHRISQRALCCGTIVTIMITGYLKGG